MPGHTHTRRAVAFSKCDSLHMCRTVNGTHSISIAGTRDDHAAACVTKVGPRQACHGNRCEECAEATAFEEGRHRHFATNL